jgi:large subunit ribosomal protein L29
MAADNLRQLDTAEIKNKLNEGQEQMFRLRFQIKMGQTDGVKKYRELRRDRARMLGVLRERELGNADKGK